MPDADDFDVEYFRSLLKGNNQKNGPAPPVEPARLSAAKSKRPSEKPIASKGKGKPVVARKKSKKR